MNFGLFGDVEHSTGIKYTPSQIPSADESEWLIIQIYKKNGVCNDGFQNVPRKFEMIKDSVILFGNLYKINDNINYILIIRLNFNWK